MARGKGNEENPVSLFPFLSILACVIGTLILLIASVSITQIESEPEEELVEQVEEYQEMEEDVKEIDAELQKMLQQLAALDTYKKKLEELKEKAKELKEEKKEQKEEDQALQQKQVELDAERRKLLEQIEKLKAQLAKQEELIARILEEIEKRRRVNSAPTVRVEPGDKGMRRGTQPTFVELDAKGLVIDPGGKKILIPGGKITTAPEFKQLLSPMAGDYDKVLVILVRADGFDLYSRTEHTARGNDVMVTKLPIVGEGELDLSRF